MFQVDRSLVNVNFECYRLASNDELCIKEYSLPSKVMFHETDCESAQFQVLADQLLKSSISDDNQVILESGHIIEITADGFIEKGAQNIAKDSATSISGKFVSTGTQIFHSGKLLDLPPSFSPSEYHFNIKHTTDEYLLGYQIVPAAKCQDLLIPESKKGSSIFWMSLLKIGNTNELVGEYYSWGRPLIARIFDGSLLLGSPTGFKLKLSTEDEEVLSDISEPLPVGFDQDDFDEEVEENQITSLVLRSFSLEGQMIAESPVVSFSGLRVLDEGILLIGTQCGVDVTVFQLVDKSLSTTHLYTINAFAFIQSGKPRKKFTSFAENLGVLCETSGSLYIYRTNSVHDKIAKQYLVELGDDEVLGLTINKDNNVLVLLPEKIIVIELS